MKKKTGDLKGKKWQKLPEEKIVMKTMEALGRNGINAYFAESEEDAKKKIFEIIPENAEIMNMTSVTLDELGVSKEILESERYNAVRNKLISMNKETQSSEMQKLGAAPDYAIGSAHAVTQDGKIIIASATGSQLPAYAYGASKLIFVIGIQKIVKNLDEAMKRIYEYTFKLEDERAKKVYGIGSGVNKLLIINKEFQENRISLIFVNKLIGF